MPKSADRTARSTLPKAEARQRYVELGEVQVLRQIQADARLLDRNRIAIGPFARLDAGALAAREGKTRGAITNVFGSQAQFQAETMALALKADQMVAEIAYPDPAYHADDLSWLDAFLTGQSARGPAHGARPKLDYGFVWALWLSALPYGIWSEAVSRPGLAEQAAWLAGLQRVFQAVIDRFGLQLAEGATLADLALAMATLIEGAWLNQCLTADHPAEPGTPIAAALVRSGRMLWQGAIRRP